MSEHPYGLPTDPFLVKAAQDRDAFCVPAYLYQQYRSQYHSAKSRGIGFSFRLLEWVFWWRVELRKLGVKATRGNRKGQYMMCRIGDVGDYIDGNVYAGTPLDNAGDVDREGLAQKARDWHSSHRCHLLGKRGDAHPKSRAVIADDVRYGSMALAAEAYGITRQAVFYRVQTGRWRYE